jgi:hypothetical protein
MSNTTSGMMAWGVSQRSSLGSMEAGRDKNDRYALQN